MKLTRILPLKKWKELESDLFLTYNLQGAVFDAEGNRITGNKTMVNRICPVIKSTPKGQSYICAVAHMNIATLAMQTREAVIEECDAGLLKLAVPIFFEDLFLGVIGGCGILTEDGEIDTFAISKIAGIDEEQVESLSSDIPAMSNETARSVCDYLETRLDNIFCDFKEIA